MIVSAGMEVEAANQTQTAADGSINIGPSCPLAHQGRNTDHI
jgi:hypothetical protein